VKYLYERIMEIPKAGNLFLTVHSLKLTANYIVKGTKFKHYGFWTLDRGANIWGEKKFLRYEKNGSE
jgi:hypothetical protein